MGDIYVGSLVSEPHLYHYGVLGMRWGVRRFQNKDGTLTSRGKTRYNNPRRSSTDKPKKERKGLSDRQKKMLKVGATLVAAGLVAYGGYKLAQSGKLDGLINRGSKRVECDILGYDSQNSWVKKKAGFVLNKDTIQSCAADINPTGSRSNCGSCAVASILNTTGDDVQALPEVPMNMRKVFSDGTVGQGYDPNKIVKAFKGSKIEDLNGNYLGTRDACKKVTAKLESYGEGAFGLLWTDKMRGRNSGHFVGWRILDGKLHILEGQPAREGIVWSDFYEGIGRNMDPGGLQWSRLDGLERDENVLKDIVKNRN